MAHPYHHAISSAKRWGGEPEDYLHIHHWFDETKASHPDFRHRALRHHTEGIFLCERIFGTMLTTSTGRKVPVRVIGEQHVREDLGRVPTASEWLSCMSGKKWMTHVQKIEGVDDAPVVYAGTKPEDRAGVSKDEVGVLLRRSI